MPYILERYGDKAIVVNSQTGKHHSLKPIPLHKAEVQMRVLQMSDHEMHSDLRHHEEPVKPINPKEAPDYATGKQRRAFMEYKFSKSDSSPDRSEVVGPVDNMRAHILKLSLFPNIYNKKFLEHEMA
jgi:hypothetical protein